MEHNCNANTQETEKEESQVKGQPRGKRDGLVVKSTNGSSKDQVQFQVPMLRLKNICKPSPRTSGGTRHACGCYTDTHTDKTPIHIREIDI